MKNSFVKEVQNFAFHEKLFQKEDGIVIGVSGGPDSTALTQVLNELKDKNKLDLSLVHVNYGLRGEESDKDEEMVRKLAEKVRLPLRVARYTEKPVGNLEQALREFRYRELEKERKTRGFARIAMGHTLDDRSETVLMNLIRGSGLKGAGGIAPKRGRIIRPLLKFEKREILEFLERTGQEYRIDRSNFDEKLFRNKIRHELIPLLERDYNPRIKKNLANFAGQIQLAGALVEQIAQNTYNRVGIVSDRNVRFKLAELVALAPVLRGPVFRRSISHLKGDVRDISSAHLFEFEKMLSSSKSKRHKFSIGTVVIERKGPEVIFSKQRLRVNQ